jgi:hypothetical protein
VTYFSILRMHAAATQASSKIGFYFDVYLTQLLRFAAEYEWSAVLEYHMQFHTRCRREMSSQAYDMGYILGHNSFWQHVHNFHFGDIFLCTQFGNMFLRTQSWQHISACAIWQHISACASWQHISAHASWRHTSACASWQHTCVGTSWCYIIQPRLISTL